MRAQEIIQDIEGHVKLDTKKPNFSDESTVYSESLQKMLNY